MSRPLLTAANLKRGLDCSVQLPRRPPRNSEGTPGSPRRSAERFEFFWWCLALVHERTGPRSQTTASLLLELCTTLLNTFCAPNSGSRASSDTSPRQIGPIVCLKLDERC